MHLQHTLVQPLRMKILVVWYSMPIASPTPASPIPQGVHGRLFHKPLHCSSASGTQPATRLAQTSPPAAIPFALPIAAHPNLHLHQLTIAEGPSLAAS